MDKIITAKEESSKKDTLPWEAEIDARVFQLYGLTEDEINQVLSSMPKVTEEEKLLIVEKWRSLEGIK